MASGQLISELPSISALLSTAVGEAEQSAVSGKFTMAVLKDFMLGRATVQIDDDAVHSFTAANGGVGGIILIHGVSEGALWGIASFQGDGTAVMSSIAEATGLDFATGVLTGTTGVDLQVTVSIDTNATIYIENRSGAVASFTYYTLNGG